MTLHTCHAVGCTTPVPPRMVLCLKHWRLMPSWLRTAISAHCGVRQEAAETPTLGHIEAIRDARRWLAGREGRVRQFEAEERELLARIAAAVAAPAQAQAQAQA